MSNYQVLARKYRPKTFEALIGQDHIATALKNAIDGGRLHHAYLFTGTRGVGKTTIARILAKCLNCETGMTSQPCGQCEACVAVDEGRFIDLIEIDAASRTKVEDTRELLENVPYAPVQGRYKVYLIDEVHMLSTHSFNALLKTLEEPPEHAKFILATTDPQKLPITIVSRCLQFVLRPLPQAVLSTHLANILQAEHILFDKNALWQLASSAKGSVRDALSLTDQAIAFGGGRINANTVNEMLGLIDGVDVLALIDDIHQDRRESVASKIEALRQKMIDAALFLELLIERIHQLAMVQLLPSLPLDMNDEDATTLRQLSQTMRGDTLQLYYEILLKSKEGLKFANTPMQGLEMAILRLLAFRPLGVGDYVKSIEHRESVDFNGQTNPVSQSALRPSYDYQSSAPTILEPKALQEDEQIQRNHQQNDHKESSYIEQDDAQTPNSEQKLYVVTKETDLVDDGAVGLFEESVLINDGADDGVNAWTDDDWNKAPEALSLAEDDHPPQNYYQKDNYQHQAHSEHQTYRQTQAQIQDEQQSQLTLSQPVDKADDKPNHLLTEPKAPHRNELKAQLSPPSCELLGMWSDEKWDYWAHHAYEMGKLSADEFALAKDSLIAGHIDGEAVLKTSEVHYQIEMSFLGLKQKLYDELGTELSLDKTVIDPSLTPQVRQEERLIKVRQIAETALLSSGVIDILQDTGHLLEGNPLSQLRLELS